MKNKKGFTLLIAIVTTSILLIISFVVVNIALKQLVLANASKESQYAFFAADGGTECAVYWDLKDSSVSAFSITTPGTIICNGQTISTGSQTVPTIPSQPSRIGGGGTGNRTSIFSVNFPKGCTIVSVTKGADGVTTIDSRGYNTCDTSASRRFERGVTLAFNNTSLGSGPIDVIWTNTGGSTISGNSLAKTASTAWGNAGEASTQSFASGNGYVEFSTNESNKYKLAGLSHDNSNQNYPEVDYGVFFGVTGDIDIYENNVDLTGQIESYIAGDVFRVAVEDCPSSCVVKYYKNGVLFYTSSQTPVFPLLLDTALYSQGSTITGAKISY